MSLQVLVFCVFLVQTVAGQGLNFTIYRDYGAKVCATLECRILPYQLAISRALELAVYNKIGYNTRIKVASVSAFSSSIFIEQCNIHNVSGSGSITGIEGQLTLSLQDADGCIRGQFECELDYIVDSWNNLQTTTAGGVPRGLCSVDSIGYRIEMLQAGVDELIMGVRADLQNLKLESSNLRTSLDYLYTWLPKIEASFRSYNDDLSKATCTAGVKYNGTRHMFLVNGYFPAICDTETEGGPWVVIQHRESDADDFNRPWADYKNGFGTKNYWIGLDALHNMTLSGYNELRVEFMFNGQPYNAEYSPFSVGDEASSYQLSLGEYNGTAGDSLGASNGHVFSTYDRNNEYGCATGGYGGGWWFYNNCYQSNLNGIWNAQVAWSAVSGNVYFTEMKVRISNG